MPRLLIMGAPGAGKGTHAMRIAERFGVPAISTGAMFRAAIASGSPLGQQVGAIVSEGGLVPDELTDAVVEARLNEPDAVNGWLLDGYPRTLEQVATLDAVLAKQGTAVDHVIMLDVPQGEVVRRLVGRAVKEGRVDDTPDVITHRQQVYEQQTAPVVAEYEKRGKVVHVDASGSIEGSGQQVDEMLDRLTAAK